MSKTLESAPDPNPIDPERLRAIEGLKAILDPQDAPVEFRAQLEKPSQEFYWVTVHYRAADISVLVSNATGLPVNLGRFRHSIQQIIDKLSELGIKITDFDITEVDGDG